MLQTPEQAASVDNGSGKVAGRVEKLRSEVKVIKQSVAENLQKINENYSEDVEEIKLFRKEIEEYVTRMEQLLLSESKRHRERNEQSMKNIEQECIEAKKELKCLLLENALEKVDDSEAAERFERKFVELESNVKEIHLRNRIERLAFNRNAILNEIIAKDIPIGDIRISLKRPEEITREERTFDNCSLERTGQIFVRVPTDKRNCWITGMTCLEKNRLACADHNNKSVKLVDVKQGTVINQVRFEHSPRDVAAIYNYQLAVTMGQEKKIEILMQDGLKKSYDIVVDGHCSGIAHRDRLLYVSYIDPPKVEVLYLEGQVWQRYTKDNFGVHMFNTPRYLDVTMNNSYESYITVSDWRTNYIRQIKLDVRKHRDKNDIGGYNAVVVLPDESLLVCGENHKVCHISADLTRSRTLLMDSGDGIANPDAMCFNAENNKLFLSNRLPGYHSDNIFMYEIKRP